MAIKDGGFEEIMRRLLTKLEQSGGPTVVLGVKWPLFQLWDISVMGCRMMSLNEAHLFGAVWGRQTLVCSQLAMRMATLLFWPEFFNFWLVFSERFFIGLKFTGNSNESIWNRLRIHFEKKMQMLDVKMWNFYDSHSPTISNSTVRRGD